MGSILHVQYMYSRDMYMYRPYVRTCTVPTCMYMCRPYVHVHVIQPLRSHVVPNWPTTCTCTCTCTFNMLLCIVVLTMCNLLFIVTVLLVIDLSDEDPCSFLLNPEVLHLSLPHSTFQGFRRYRKSLTRQDSFFCVSLNLCAVNEPI